MVVTGQTQAKLSHAPTPSGILRRKCACGQHTVAGGECAECKQKREGVLQRATSHRTVVNTVPPIVHEVLRSPGQPLDVGTRAFMEPRFGHDFSQVRVHTDAKAGESARAVNALAYTVGKNVVFGKGQYISSTVEGRRLLAHELAHVVQQRQSQKSPMIQTLQMNILNDAHEREANILATQVTQEQAVDSLQLKGGLTTARLQRQFITPLGQGGGFGGLMERDRRAAMEHTSSGGEQSDQSSSASPTVYICSKALETSPLGSHAFFRIGGPSTGNPTISLQPIDSSLGANCWQGIPDSDYPSDKNAEAECEAMTISLACLNREFGAYPIGRYCTLGPNSNTFVGHIAKRCGISNPDPPGWTPGIDDSPPPRGTYAPDKWETLTGCTTKVCVIGPESPREPPIG